MSWISGLADKAENILNKIDQNAATLALQLPVTAAELGADDHPTGAAVGISNTIATTPTLDVLRKSLSTHSLKTMTTLSPKNTAKTIQKGTLGHRGGGGGGSVKSEGGYVVSMADSMELMSTSLSSKVDDAAASVAIDMGGVTHAEAKQEMSAFLTANTGEQRQELAAFKIALSEVSSERDELRQRLLALNHDVENDSLRQRVHELELLAQRLNEEREQAQLMLHEAQIASSAYVHSISELESNLAKMQQEFVEMAQKLQMQIKETEQQRLELREYRVKAQRALQTKDQLIAELKASGGSGGSGETGGTFSEAEAQRLLQIEYDALRQEQLHSVAEQRSLTLQMEEMRRDSTAYAQQHAVQLTALCAAEESLRKELRVERENALANESEQRVLTHELQTLRQQLSNQMAAAATRLQEKENQLQQLRSSKEQLSRKPAAGVDGASSEFGDYDTRVKALTQALVDKQNAVEHVTAERNALRIQLEKVQDQLQQSIYNHPAAGQGTPRNALLSNSTDDVKAQFPLLMKANPFDNRVARRVKRAYSSLDSAGIRLGAFLRRYPLMRTFVLMYVALLHFWVMFVLVSYTPN